MTQTLCALCTDFQQKVYQFLVLINYSLLALQINYNTENTCKQLSRLTSYIKPVQLKWYLVFTRQKTCHTTNWKASYIKNIGQEERRKRYSKTRTNQDRQVQGRGGRAGRACTRASRRWSSIVRQCKLKFRKHTLSYSMLPISII